MKKTIQKLIPLLLCATVLTPTLASCDTVKENTTPDTDKPTVQQSASQNNISTNTQSSTQSNTPDNTLKEEANNDITTDSYKEQISYYMNLTESLQNELVNLKEEAYIDECEYQLKISALEETIEMLKKTVASLSGDNSTSTGIQEPSNDSLSAKSDYKYTVENGKLTITEYTGKEIDVTIPALIDGMPVAAIGEDAFKGSQIRSVILPSGIMEIGWFAFSSCTVLESITIPSSVTNVGYGAFDYCPKSLKIHCEKGSYIEAYAKSWGMNVVAK